MTKTSPSSALLIIGNEILSGRTQDANLRFLAKNLGEIGLPLREVRVVPDVHEVIVRTVDELRARFNHVFTTGGIGPTHDDITAECIAAAFGVPLELHPASAALLAAHYGQENFTPARQRMAMLPRGATPIANPVSVAPGFTIGNVHVMAGVPSIMQSMFMKLLPELPRGTPVQSRAWHAVDIYESLISDKLRKIQEDEPLIDIGSYPWRFKDGRKGVTLVAKGTDPAILDSVSEKLKTLISDTGAIPVEGEPEQGAA